MAAAAGGLLALAVAFGLLYNTSALSLSQNSTAANLSGEESEFYDYEGRHCKMCPAGSHVSHHCETTGTNSSCKPCSSDSFTTHSNQFHACVPCKICRPLDQVTLKSCSRTSNAECACKEGTYCSPDQPCETCHKCKPRCPKGEEMVQPCTPQSDIQCVPIPTSSTVPTISPTPSPGKNMNLLWVLCGIALACIIVFLMYWYRRKLRCCFRDHTTTTRANSIRSKTLLWLQTKFTHGQPGSEDNEWNTQVDLAPQSHPGLSATRQPDETVLSQEKKCLIPVEEERRKLVPADGKDPESALRLSFYHIAENMPFNKWRPYMTVLGLTDNEIEIAEANAKGNVVEQRFQMLKTWQEKNGTQASLDTLLKTLCDPAVNLKGIERKIREALISMDLYAYEE